MTTDNAQSTQPVNWPRIDAKLEAMTNNELLKLPITQFARDSFNKAVEEGKDPKQVPEIHQALRDAVLKSACQFIIRPSDAGFMIRHK